MGWVCFNGQMEPSGLWRMQDRYFMGCRIRASYGEGEVGELELRQLLI